MEQGDGGRQTLERKNQVMKRILVISWFYPPINSSEGLVTYKLLRNSGMQYDVCMQDGNDSWSYGKNEMLPESEHVHKIAIQGDSLELWKQKVIEYFTAHKDNYEVVMTRSMPPECHEIGLKIKNIKPEVTWIASFGDPIADNPFVLNGMKKVSPYSLKNSSGCRIGISGAISPKRILKNLIWKRRIRKEQLPLRREQRLERDIITHCDYVIMNNPYQKQYMMEKYNEVTRNKAIILPHSFDSSLYDKEVEQRKTKKIRMVYIGHLDDIRSPHLLFKSVLNLKNEQSDLADRLEIFFYGNMSAKEKVYLLDHELLDIVHIKKPVDYKTSLAIMKNSDWLIHIDANLSNIVSENIFFAAKLADYIGAGRPIFAITMFDGAGADVVRDVNGVIVSYTVDEIKNYLYLIVYKDYQIAVNEKNRAKYDAVNVAMEFDNFLENRVLH